MKNRKLLSVCGCIILTVFLITFISRGGTANEPPPAPLAQIPAAGRVKVSGTLLDKEAKDHSTVLILKNSSVIYQNRIFSESRIIIYIKEMQEVSIGEHITLAGRLYCYTPERNPGNFDQQFYYEKQGIHARVVASDEQITLSSVSAIRRIDRLREALRQFRQNWQQAVLRELGEKDGSILNAVMLGDKGGMDEEIREIYQLSGIGHILAISGLHISVIGMTVFRLLRRLSGSFPFGALGGFLFLLTYILMIGVSVSVLRAFIMFLFRIGAEVAGRRYDAPTALGAAAAVTLLHNPLLIYDSGAWLSYLAAAGMMLMTSLFETFRLRFLTGAICVNTALFGIVIYTFFEFPLYSIFLNLLILPLMSLLLFLGLAGSGLLGLWPAAGKGLLKLTGLILRLYQFLSESSLQLPLARVITGQPALWQVLLYYGLLAALVIILYRKKKNIKYRHRPLILFYLLSILVFAIPFSRGKTEITMLDVGQGDGIFIGSKAGRTVFIDGGSTDVDQVGRYRIEPFLKSRGVRRIDYCLISHGDADHLSGICELLERGGRSIPIRCLVLPPRRFWNEEIEKMTVLARQRGVKVYTMTAGDRLSVDELEFSCLAPAETLTTTETNAGSMVLSLQIEDFRILLTGDCEKDGETALLNNYNRKELRHTVLKVAHHGSKNSSPAELLERIDPRLALISAGIDNSYGHPHTETMERLGKTDAAVLTTQKCGAVTIRTDGTGLSVTRHVTEK